MDVKKLNEIINKFDKDLTGGLQVASLWVRGELPLVTYGGGNDKGSILFDQISSNIEKTLQFADFPEIDPYYLWKVEGDMVIGAVLVENVQVGIVVNIQKVSLGVLLNIAIPNLVDALKKNLPS